ncbi:MAG: VOC family protein [Actinobacteria bacterium]|nr:VOC family protein [Actinomycetota bacterium]
MLGDYPVTATVPTADLERAAAFYSDVLGLTEVGAMEGESVHYECGAGTMLELYRTRAGVGNGHTEAGWQVDDIEAVVAGLRERGVEFEEYDLGDGMKTENGILAAGDDKAAWFKDPDGNVLGVFQASE